MAYLCDEHERAERLVLEILNRDAAKIKRDTAASIISRLESLHPDTTVHAAIALIKSDVQTQTQTT